MVVTIGLAQLFGGIQLLVPGWMSGPSIVGGVTDAASSHHVLIFPVLFNGNDLLIVIVVPVVLVALGWFLLRTDAGIAVRSVADNTDRARLLGIPVRRLSTLVWVIAGVLAALTSILSAPSRASPSRRGPDRPSSCPRWPPPSSPAWRTCRSPSAPAWGSASSAGSSSSTCPATAASIGDVVNLVAILLGLLFLQRKREPGRRRRGDVLRDRDPQADPRRAAQAARGRGRARSAVVAWSPSSSS